MKLFRNIEPMLKPNPKQTFIGIWLHDDNLEDEVKDKMEIYLNQTFYYYRIFIDMEKFTLYMHKKRRVAKIFFIISFFDFKVYDSIGLIREYFKLEKIYIFLPIEPPNSIYFKTTKIDNLFTKILEDLKNFINRPNQAASVEDEINTESKPINISRITKTSTSLNKFIPKPEQSIPIHQFTEESSTFLSFLIMTRILLSISYTTNETSDMWRVCRDLYQSDHPALSKIDSLAKKYTSDEAIRYYTESSCLFRTVNQACRTENLQRMYEFRVYISDLHRQLGKLDTKQNEDGTKLSIRQVYRGKILAGCVLQQLIDNECGLISLNGFLSTTKTPKVANTYAGIENQIEEGRMSVKFVLTIDQIKQPYANVSSCSAIPDDDEVLFSLGTIWCIKSITLKENFYEIELASSNSLDSHLHESVEKYVKNGCHLSLVGDILRENGNYKEAEWFYEKVLNPYRSNIGIWQRLLLWFRNSPPERVRQNHLAPETRGHLYYHIGMMRQELGNESGALDSFAEAARLLQSLSMKSSEKNSSRGIYTYDTESTLIAVYYNMAVLHDKKGEFNDAIECCKQALEKQGPSLEMAKVRDKLGLLYFRDGEYEQARKYHAEAVKYIDESQSCWLEFNRNLNNATKHCEYLKNNNQKNHMQRTTIDKLTGIVRHLSYRIIIIIFLSVFVSTLFITLRLNS